MKIFENQQLDIDLLPRMKDIEFIKPHRSYLYMTMIQSVVFWLIMFGIFSLSVIAAREEFYEFILYARLLFYPTAILSILLTWIGFHKRGHALRTHDIMYKEGVLFQNKTNISFNRVQHCETSQGPLEQMFDLHTLKVFTAGGQSSDLSIPGLHEDIAANLKEFIVVATAAKKGHSEEE